MTVKKKQIGFFNVNETKPKASIETEQAKDEQQDKCTIPPHVIDEIEEHILAKQDLEKSMHTLYLFKRGLKIILIIFAFIFAGIIFYSGYKYGEKVTIDKFHREIEYKNVLNEIYLKGYSDAKFNRISVMIDKK